MPKINVYLPDDLAEAVRDSGLPVSAVCQRALEDAVRRITAIRQTTLDDLDTDQFVKLAKEVPGLEVNMPQGAFYLFPKCNSYFGKSNGEKTINNSTDFAMYLLEEAHVATVGGDAFGDPDCFRMSYATSDENIVEAIKRIKEALGKLK